MVLSKETGFTQIRISWDDNSIICSSLIIWILLDVDESSLVPPKRPLEFIAPIDPAAVNTSAHVFSASAEIFFHKPPLSRFFSQPNLLFFSKCSQTLISFLILKKRKPAFQSVMLYLESVWGICFWVILSFLRRSPHTCVLRGIFSWSSWSWAEVSRYPLQFKEALCGWKEPLVCAYCWITAAVYIVSTVSFAVSSDHFTITGWYGENVTLPCRYDAQAHGSLSFCWGQAKVPMSKCSRTIVSSVDGAVPVVQSPRHQLAGRVGDGDVSLTILNARWSDGGEYGCRVEIPGWFNDHKVDFQLVIADGETPEQGPG